jgi:hypothetical protein
MLPKPPSKPFLSRVRRHWREILEKATLEEVQLTLNTIAKEENLRWNEIEWFGDSLLKLAVWTERKDVFSHLLHSEGSLSAIEKEGPTLLEVALRHKPIEWIHFILDAAEEQKVTIVNNLDRYHVPPLYWVKTSEQLHLLLERKADPTLKLTGSAQRNSIAENYAYHGSHDLLMVLLERGVPMTEDVLVQTAEGHLSVLEDHSTRSSPVPQHGRILSSMRQHLKPSVWTRASTTLHQMHGGNQNFPVIEHLFPLPKGRDILRELDRYATRLGVVETLQNRISHGCRLLAQDIALIIRDYAIPDLFLLNVSEKSLSCLPSFTFVPPRIWCALLRLEHVSSWLLKISLDLTRCGPSLFKKCSRRWDDVTCTHDFFSHEHHIHVGDMIRCADIVALVEEPHLVSMPFSFGPLTQTWRTGCKEIFLQYAEKYRTEYLKMFPSVIKFQTQDEVLSLLKEVKQYFEQLGDVDDVDDVDEYENDNDREIVETWIC